MGPLISGKSRLVKYYSIWPELFAGSHTFFCGAGFLPSTVPNFESQHVWYISLRPKKRTSNLCQHTLNRQAFLGYLLSISSVYPRKGFILGVKELGYHPKGTSLFPWTTVFFFQKEVYDCGVSLSCSWCLCVSWGDSMPHLTIILLAGPYQLIFPIPLDPKRF